MAVVSNYYEDALLDCLRNVSDAVISTGVFMKLHTGDPGADCTANAAQHVTRIQVTFGSAASGGTISNTAAVTFSSLYTDETISYVSMWDTDTTDSGNALYYDSLTTAKAVNTGDTLEFAIGDVDINMDV